MKLLHIKPRFLRARRVSEGNQVFRLFPRKRGIVEGYDKPAVCKQCGPPGKGRNIGALIHRLLLACRLAGCIA